MAAQFQPSSKNNNYSQTATQTSPSEDLPNSGADVVGIFERLNHRKNPYLSDAANAAREDLRKRLPTQFAQQAARALSEASHKFPNHNVLTLAAGLSYAEAGLHVVDSHALDSSGKGTGPGGQVKIPRGAKWQDRASTDQAEIISFWTGEGDYPADKNGRAYPYAPPPALRNVSVTFPKDCGLFVMDIDGDDGKAALEKLEAEHGELPQTWESITGSGGYHLIFRANGADIRNTASSIAPGVDIRGANGQIIAPPSVHPNGNFYLWDEGCAPWECEVADAPEWLVKLSFDATKGRGNGETSDKKRSTAKKSNRKARHSARQGDAIGFEGHLETIGDGNDQSGFDGPIYKAACSYFSANGSNADGDELFDILRATIVNAEMREDQYRKDRYLSDDGYLEGRIEQAREFISQQDQDDTSVEQGDTPDHEESTPDGVSLNISDPLGEKLPEALATLKKRWAVVNVGGKVLFMPRPDPDRDTGAGVQFFSETEFKKFHRNRTVRKKGKSVQPAIVFAETASRHAEIVFAPTPVVASKHAFNLWNGYKADKAPSGAGCDKLKAFIKDVICGGRDEVYRWLWLWLAHLAQRPGEKPGTALVIQGTGGCGKSYFGTILTRLFAPYTVFADRAEHVTGQFNRHLATAVLMVSDEALFGGDPRVSGLIKSMVTTAVQRIEAKGVDSIEVASFLRCVFIGNPKRVVPIEANGSDRRYLCLSIADTYKDDTEYFGAIEDEIVNGGLHSLFAELSDYNPASDELNWNMLRVAPETEEKKNMRRLSLPKVQRKFIESVEDGAFELREESGRFVRYDLSDSEATLVVREHMRTALAKWADSRDGGQDAREVLADMFGDAVTATRRKVSFLRRDFDGSWETDERSKAWCYVLPSRAAMLDSITEKFAE